MASAHTPHSALQGFSADNSIYTGRIKDTTFRSLLDSYLGFGENIFAFVCGFAVSSSYFRRQLDD